MNKQAVILLVEDNEELNALNRRALELAGYDVLTATTLAEARAHLVAHAPDVFLLDVLLPDGDGIDFCREIRDTTDAHILFLTSKTEHADRIRGLNTGGDDYITKPYKLAEMLARVSAALRRRRMSTPETVVRGTLTLDVVAGRAYIAGQDILLSPKEFALLLHFSMNPGAHFTFEALYEAVWKTVPDDNARAAFQVRISSLRKKLRIHGHGTIAIELDQRKYYHLTHTP